MNARVGSFSRPSEHTHAKTDDSNGKTWWQKLLQPEHQWRQEAWVWLLVWLVAYFAFYGDGKQPILSECVCLIVKGNLGISDKSPVVKRNWRDKLILARNVKANQSDISLIKATTGRMD